MADINATNLTPETLSTLDGTENIVAFDTAEGKKIPLSVLGDYVVQKLTQTLLGQTQSVANAIKQCYSLHGGQIVSSGFNFDTCTDVGNYSIPTTSLANSATGTKPISVPIGYLKVLRTRDSSNVISQIFYEYSAVAVYYTRNYTVSSQTWSDWVKTPTRTEIDKISAIVGMSDPGSMTSYSTQQFTVASSSRHLIILSGEKTAVHGLLLVSANQSGEVFLTSIHAGNGLVITAPSNNILQVQNTSNVACYFTDICTNGTAITKVT